ncbi:MAG TPA: M1 family metallopeptidase [Gemmatimonadaceae bacterium]|nr:M1 family metallopeptidase [Gemmatimonadaceae bacterium]
MSSIRPPILALLPVIALACAQPPRPQVLAPVRFDSAATAQAVAAASAGSDTAGSATAAPAATAATAARDVRTMADDPFFPIDRDRHLPGPNRYRDASGRPGPDYWQQRADYAIAATLDTAAQSVRGTVRIRYTNNSPDTLRFLWLQLDQNLYRPGSKGSAINPADSRWGVRGFEGGYQLSDVQVDGRAVTPHVDDTMMRLDLAQPLAPGGDTAIVSMGFSFRVPEHGSDRMGRDGTLYEIAQWYPRMAVYDDVRGWNTDPYLGQGEFYLEYGDYDFAITAPAGYTIAASGVLQNPEEVLSAAQRERLARARKASDVVQIITPAEAVARPTPGTKTWRFHAERVHDVAWAGAPDFRWDATSWNGILTQAYFQPQKTNGAWDQAAEQTQWTIRTYSQLFFPYPYPQATSVAGPVGGMEYPMFVMVHYGRNGDPNTVFGTIDHEHGHEWFPMIVGSNERRYAWMDEGINTYINTFSNERRYPGRDVFGPYLQNWASVIEAGTDEPIMTPPDHLDRGALGALGYRKPAVVLLTLRNHVLDPETFDRAFREYIRRWAFKHPTPGDFFRTVEDVSGVDLSWYWRGFFYSNDVLDIGVGAVAMRTDSTGTKIASIPLRQLTSIPFPVTMRLQLADGATREVRLPVDIWANGRQFTAELTVPSAVTGVRLWPAGTVPDWNPANDTWGSAPPADPKGPVTGK